MSARSARAPTTTGSIGSSRASCSSAWANTLLSFIAYRLLLALEVPYVIAAALGFSVGALNGYVFNRRWTFAARDTARARVVYVAVQAAGAASTSLLVLFFVGGLGVDKVAGLPRGDPARDGVHVHGKPHLDVRRATGLTRSPRPPPDRPGWPRHGARPVISS